MDFSFYIRTAKLLFHFFKLITIMAKVEGIFSTRLRGKVGQVVFRQSNGENIVSQYNGEPKNPRTTLQQVQRMKMHTVSELYASAPDFFNSSIQGASGSANTMAEFMRLNLLAINVTPVGDAGNFSPSIYNGVVPKGVRSAPPAGPWLLSSGSLSAPTISSTGGDNELVTLISPADTLQNFINATGVELGDQISVIICHNNGEQAIFTNSAGEKFEFNRNSRPYYMRITLKSAYDTTELATSIISSGKFNTGLFASMENTENFNVTFSGGVYTIGLDTTSLNLNSPNADTLWAGIVISRKTASSEKRSTSYAIPMGIAAAQDALEGSMQTSGVLQTYSPNGLKFLNNAL